MSEALCFIFIATSHTIYDKVFSLYALKLLLKIMASTYDFAVNIVILINIAINKTLNIYESVKKLSFDLFKVNKVC